MNVRKKLKIATFVTSEVPFPVPKDFKGIYAPVGVALSVAEGLAKRGHEVLFYGPIGSQSKICKVREVNIEPLYKNKILKLKEVKGRKEREKISYLFDQYIVSSIFKENSKEKFDIIHIHPVDRVLPFALLTKTPVVYTLHDPVYSWRAKIFKMYQTKNQYFISLSNAQRRPAPNLNWAGTIYNGINLKSFPFNPKPKNYLLFLGRILPRKGPHLAIQAAIKAKENLVIAGVPNSGIFWQEKIQPFLKRKNIKYRGFLPYRETYKLYQNAKALLCPIQWEEPFGLTFIESMACGTPVIAFDRGSAREVVKDGKTGFVVKNIEEMIEAIKKIDEIKRENCRARVEKKFTIERMVNDYEKVFYQIIRKGS